MSDLISREELTKKLEYLCDCLCDYSKKQRKFMCDACKLGAVIDAVEEMPSVEPERKPGKWIKVVDEETSISITWHYECSSCGSRKGWKDYHYCPSCGAKMEVDDAE